MSRVLESRHGTEKMSKHWGKFRFGPASSSEQNVYGAARPGYPGVEGIEQNAVDEWVTFMRDAGITRIVCLLDDEQLRDYERRSRGLLETYREGFGKVNVLHAPIRDYRLCDPDLLVTKILPFLRASDEAGEKAVVHCLGGLGRTGHVLAAWLVYGRRIAPSRAIGEVRETGRQPREAVTCGQATDEQLMTLLRQAAGARP